jgi:hypothetical protein
VILGSFAVPSLTAYRELFALCAGASLLAAMIVLMVPRHGAGHGSVEVAESEETAPARASG